MDASQRAPTWLAPRERRVEILFQTRAGLEEKELRDVLVLAPEHVLARRRLVELLAARRAPEGALILLAPTAWPGPGTNAMNEGIQRLERNGMPILAGWLNAVALSPWQQERVGYWRRSMRYQLKRGKHRLAEGAAGRATTLSGDATSWLELAEELAANGHLDEAHHALRTLSRLPDTVRVEWPRLQRLARGLGRMALAEWAICREQTSLMQDMASICGPPPT